MVNLVRWNPRKTDIRTFEQMFDELWRNPWNLWEEMAAGNRASALRPAMDVIENSDNVTIRIDLPGLSPDNVNIEVEGDLLTISGEMGDTVEREGEHYHYRERNYGSFKRSLRLPDTIDTENVDATFSNGVLNLVLPKRPEMQPKQIKVQAK